MRAPKPLLVVALALLLTGLLPFSPAAAAGASGTDLRVLKSDNQDPIATGGTLGYALKVENLGTKKAQGVVLVDRLPNRVTFVSATASAGSCTYDEPSHDVTCSFGILEQSGTRIVDIQVVVDSEHDRTIVNLVSVGSKTHDPVTANNTDSEETLVLGREADLEISKGDQPDPVPAGEQLTYTLGVTNHGPDPAPSTIIEDNLPDSVDFVSATSTSGSCAEAAGRVTCQLGDLPTGTSETVTIDVVPQQEGTITNRASVRSDRDDPDQSNNSVAETTSVTSPLSADLKVTGSGPTTATIGESVAYTFDLDNLGPDNAMNATFEITTSPGLSITSVNSNDNGTGTGAGCASVDAHHVTCDLHDFSGTETLTVNASATADTLGDQTVTGVIASDTADPNSANNSVVVTTTVVDAPQADLHVAVTGPSSATQGDNSLIYDVELTSSGPQAAGNVDFTITLTPGLELQFIDDAGSNAQGFCQPAGPQQINCTLTDFDPGEIVHLSLTVSATGTGSQSVTATAVSDTADPNESDNSDVVNTEVTPI